MKTVYIINQYNMPPEYGHLNRHYYLAKYLKKDKYEPIVFVGSYLHNNDIQIISDNSLYKEYEKCDFKYYFVKTYNYAQSKVLRVMTMFQFYRNVIKLSKVIKKPDIVIASSPHPISALAAFKIAKKNHVECIVEVRDLWPASFSAYGILSEKSPIMKLLYLGEKWIYKKADKIIFTMEGGKDYIIDKGWNKESGGPIDLSKVYHINNGVDLELFKYNKDNYKLKDMDLENDSIFKVIYTGSIRKANDIQRLVDTAKIIQDKGYKNIMFLIYGEGDEKEALIEYCKANNITNVKFKGKVDKKYIPYVLSKSDLNIMHFKPDKLAKYGASLNKLFDYFASGKPILSDKEFGYDLIKKYNCGEVLDSSDEIKLAEKIIEFFNMPKEQYEIYSRNAMKAAQDYDFKNLTKKLEKIIDDKGGH